MKPVVLLTDAFVFALLAGGFVYWLLVRRRPQLAASWALALRRPAGAVCALILGFFLAGAVGLSTR